MDWLVERLLNVGARCFDVGRLFPLFASLGQLLGKGGSRVWGLRA